MIRRGQVDKRKQNRKHAIKMEEDSDEAGKLKAANEHLREELINLKQMVELLREQRADGITCDEKEETPEQREDRLLRLENDLLRAQLREQADFLVGCRELMDQIPELRISTSSLVDDSLPPLPKVNEEELMKQGAENAMTHLLLLVSRSQTCNDWQAVELPEHCFRTAVPGLNLTCNFRKEVRDPVNRPGENMVCIRVDACFPSISPEAVAGAYWATWTNKKSFASLFNAFFGVPQAGTAAGEPPVPFLIKDLMQSAPTDREDVRVNLYRELQVEDKELRDWIYCMTKQRREIAMSTLNMNAELNPSVAARRNQHTRKIVQGALPARKRGKGCTSSSQLMGRQECIVLARTCMRGEQRKALSALSANHTIAEDGLFVWQDEVSIDYEVKCDGGTELQRKRVPATRASSFIAFPESYFVVHDTDLYTAVLDASGKATEKYAKLIDLMYTMMGMGGGT